MLHTNILLLIVLGGIRKIKTAQYCYKILYSTAQFKLQECMRVQVHAHDTGIEIFVMCLHVHERLMTYELPMQTSRTYASAIARARYEYTNIHYVLSCA